MFEKLEKILTAEELKKEFPINAEIEKIKAENDEILKNIITGKDERFLIVSGPCSADNSMAVLEYCRKLAEKAEKSKSKLVIMPRIFTAKPRTNGDGYLGMMYEPNGGNKVDINKGLKCSRKLMLDIINETKMPIADEILYPEYYDYLNDLVSYYFIGARSSENPEHKNIGSGLDIAVGVKNSTGGNLASLAGSIHACENPKEFLLKGYQVKTNGNKYAHAVLRGYVDISGIFYTNFNDGIINAYSSLCDNYGVNNKRILVDCSHANSSKQCEKQIQTAKEVIRNRNKLVMGIMLESYLISGKNPDKYGCSKTDACIGWDETSMLIDEIFNAL